MRVRVLLVALLVLGALGLVAQADWSYSNRDAGANARSVMVQNARRGAPAKAPPARSLAAATGDDRRYALANGCYSLRDAGTGGFVAKDPGGYGAAGASGGASTRSRTTSTLRTAARAAAGSGSSRARFRHAA